jgi:hypothetical protein
MASVSPHSLLRTFVETGGYWRGPGDCPPSPPSTATATATTTATATSSSGGGGGSKRAKKAAKTKAKAKPRAKGPKCRVNEALLADATEASAGVLLRLEQLWSQFSGWQEQEQRRGAPGGGGGGGGGGEGGPSCSIADEDDNSLYARSDSAMAVEWVWEWAHTRWETVMLEGAGRTAITPSSLPNTANTANTSSSSCSGGACGGRVRMQPG